MRDPTSVYKEERNRGRHPLPLAPTHMHTPLHPHMHVHLHTEIKTIEYLLLASPLFRWRNKEQRVYEEVSTGRVGKDVSWMHWKYAPGSVTSPQSCTFAEGMKNISERTY